MSSSPEINVPADRQPETWRRDVRISLLVGLACLLIYNANLRSIGSGDTLPARYLPFGLWRYGTLALDPIRDVTIEGHALPYWIVKGRAGRSVSMYPVVLPVLVAPLYLPAVAYLHFTDWTEWRLRLVATVMEKLVSSLVAAVATALFFLLLRRRATLSDALILTLAFGFGTNTWMIGSQALWQHGLPELLLVGVLLLLTGPCTTARALVAGALFGLIVGERSPNLLLVAGLFLYGVHWARRRTIGLLLGAAVPLGLVLAYNVAVVGNLLGGYGSVASAVSLRRALAFFFGHGLLTGVAGLLVSPTRGLFVFSPFLILAPAAFLRGLRDRDTRALTLAIGVGVLAQTLLYAKADWRAGHSWGPRWLTDLLPLLVFLLPPALAALHGLRRTAFMLAIGVSVAIQAVGAFYYISTSDVLIFAVLRGPDVMRAAWNPRNTPFWVELRNGLAYADPAFNPWRELRAQGNIDRVTTSSGGGESLPAGAPVTLEGWALTNDLSPAAVEITVDGHLRGVTTTFFERPDVRATLHAAAPAGWRLEIGTDGLEPGPHVLAAAARFRQSAIAVPVVQRALTVVPRETQERARAAALAAAAVNAAALIRSHQQREGYWLTSYTSGLRFEAPRQEMNTFLTSMMVDLLAPVAAEEGLGESVERARAHLAGQIEATGLVRYHGRPDAPTIGTLGCKITPDADDTALVWRLVAHDRPALLRRALAVLKQYRTDEGLYRTWLAPRERYECIDPGKDPDPTDVAIQMHVLLLLSEVEPPAALALCDALGHGVGEGRLWVYYERTPVVPLLRQADLRRAGCSLRLPEERLRTSVDGQEVWLTVARMLSAADSSGRSSERTALLDRLAKDEFLLVRQTPPLLYHNDLTATVRRFYWSEDFGYALWLRLYLEETRRRDDTKSGA